jgi:hypothetical protein
MLRHCGEGDVLDLEAVVAAACAKVLYVVVGSTVRCSRSRLFGRFRRLRCEKPTTKGDVFFIKVAAERVLATRCFSLG